MTESDKNMQNTLHDRFNTIINKHLGLTFKGKYEKELDSKLYHIVNAMGFESKFDCIFSLENSPMTNERIAIIAKYLTIGETYFFRESRTFEMLEKHIIPDLIKKKTNKKLRVWSAACATGEEPYSIAMLLDKMMLTQNDWDITIIGTDINSFFLDSARKGLYREWSFRSTPAEMRKRYFKKTSDGFETLNKDIKAMVQFHIFNLIDANYPLFLRETFDLILCNNVLIYFSQEKIDYVIENLTDHLEDKGWLITTPIEMSYVSHPLLQSYEFDRMPIFKKEMSKIFSQQSVKKAIIEEKNNSPTQDLKELLKSQEVKFKFKQLMLLAREEADKTDFAAAKKLCEEAFELNKLDPQLYLLYSSILKELNLRNESLRAIQNAIFLEPDLATAHFTLGNFLLANGQSEEAQKSFLNALHLAQKIPPSDKIPGIEDLTAGQLVEMIYKSTSSY